ncbi:MAG: DinB family protein [Saprospiraceae bacterium]|nr:DinB family protein [Saprospiraceae bacterium]
MSEVVALIQEEFKRRVFVESYSRIENCIDRLTQDQIWHKANKNTNSIGNLVLHLMGNVRQYICSGLGGQNDIRQRDLEFLASSACNTSILRTSMQNLKVDVTSVIDSLTEKNLIALYKVQGFEENGTSILIHVIEHFSYHVGQIAQYTKLLLDEDLGFYAGLDLNIKSK